MTESDLLFYMGGNVLFNNKIIANLTIDGPPLKYILLIEEKIISCESRSEAVNKIISYLEKKNDQI
jgi:hypothetical protein